MLHVTYNICHATCWFELFRWITLNHNTPHFFMHLTKPSSLHTNRQKESSYSIIFMEFSILAIVRESVFHVLSLICYFFQLLHWGTQKTPEVIRLRSESVHKIRRNFCNMRALVPLDVEEMQFLFHSVGVIQ